MTKRFFYTAVAALALSAPAQAQAPYPQQGVLPPYEIVSMLRSTGFDPLGQPVRRGPNYVLRAVDDSDREVRVVVDARSGDVRSVTPVQTASRIPPGGSMGPYEPMPPGYIPPGSYRSGAPIIDEDDDGPLPQQYGTRPPAPLPSGPPPARANALPPPAFGAPASRDDGVSRRPSTASNVIPADPEPQRDGMLPPPPERFPARAAPASPPKPKPVTRAAVVPKAAPLPKAKPNEAAPAATAPAPQSAPPSEPAQPPAAEETPN